MLENPLILFLIIRRLTGLLANSDLISVSIVDSYNSLEFDSIIGINLSIVLICIHIPIVNKKHIINKIIATLLSFIFPPICFTLYF